MPAVIDGASRRYTVSVFLIGLVLSVVTLYTRFDRSAIAIDPGSLFLGRLRHALLKEGVGYGYETLPWLILPALMSAVASQFLGSPPRRGWLVIGLLLLSMAVVSPIGSREILLSSSIAVVVVSHYRYRNIPIRWVLLTVGVGYVLNVIIVLNRSGLDFENDFAVAALGSTISFDGFESLVQMSKRFSIEDVVWGRTYFESMAFTLMPRMIWTGKPMIYGTYAAQDYVFPELIKSYGVIGTYPIGYVAEALYNLWYFGLLLIPAAFGAGLSVMERLAKARQKSGYFAILPAIFAGQLIGWIRSPSDEMLGLLLLSFFVWLALRKRRAPLSMTALPPVRFRRPSQGAAAQAR
jgi:hypothetical protein